MQNIERENPLLEMDEVESQDGEIILKGNLVLLNLNLSRMLKMCILKNFQRQFFRYFISFSF